MTANSTTGAAADRVVLRYAPATDRVREELTTSRYRTYLRRVEAGPVAAGDEWDHFVSRGCGSTRDVTLVVESVEGGDRIGEETAFEFVPAEGEGHAASDATVGERSTAANGR